MKFVERLKNNRVVDNWTWILGMVALLGGLVSGSYAVFRFFYCETYPAFNENISVMPTQVSLERQTKLYEFLNTHLGRPIYLDVVFDLESTSTDSECNRDDCDWGAGILPISEVDDGKSISILPLAAYEEAADDKEENLYGRYEIVFNKDEVNYRGNDRLCCAYRRLSGFYVFQEVGPMGGVTQYSLRPANALDANKQECTVEKY